MLAAEPTTSIRQRLGGMLVAAGVVRPGDIDRALEVQARDGGRLGSILVRQGACTDDQVREALRVQLGLPVVALRGLDLGEEQLALIPKELIRRYEVVPLGAEGRTLRVAMTDPFNLTAVDDLRFATPFRHIEVSCCTEDDYERFALDHFAARSAMHEILESGDLYERAVSAVGGEPLAPMDDELEADSDLKAAGEQPPIITLCNYLLVEAVRRHASDIHIEPYETYFRVRFRIDGCLHTILTPPQRLHVPIISRLKIRAGMDISKRRIPQDGHIAISCEGETVHFRVSTLPTLYGEKCVIRLLKKDQALHSLATLGFDGGELKVLARCIRAPQGLILVTGPTGSGKTTTLHAALNDINQPDVNIVTLEDPVEASIAGINHVDTGSSTHVTFATGLRSILRQDPDVVFIGEMRDPEVCSIAIKAALTGHLVLSTLHTNSAAASLIRLADMDVPGYLLADALLLIIAQRLVRRVCDGCAEPYVPTDAEVAEFALTEAQLVGASMLRGAGCGKCMRSGDRGRLAVYELLNVTSEVREVIRRGGRTGELLGCARASGMRLLYDGGVARALDGVTTLDEVRRVLLDTQK